MKKNIALFLAAALTAGSLTACGGGKDSQTSTTAAKTADQGGGSEQKAPEGGDSQGSSDTVFPAGTLTVYAMGNPQYRQQYFETWLENHRDIAPDVKIEFVQTEGTADIREKITMTALSGATEDLPDAAMLDQSPLWIWPKPDF